jgi:predicted adenine nucleotide alpha hydrolase (AANH) superfamily ATPase
MLEVDGPQHFERVFWYDPNGSDLKDQICRDLAKNRFAADNGMSLLRVSYKEYNDLEKWVNMFLEKCNNADGQVMIPSNPALYNSQRDINLTSRA